MAQGINHGIQIRAEAGQIDTGRPTSGFGDGSPWHKSARWDWAKLSDRSAVPSHDKSLPALNLTKNGRGVVA